MNQDVSWEGTCEHCKEETQIRDDDLCHGCSFELGLKDFLEGR